MDPNHKNNDTYLSDWLAGNLTDDQLRELVGESEFVAYEKLKNSIGRLQVDDPDLDRNYAAIKEKRINKFKPKAAHTISLYHYVAIAAALLMFFGLFQFFAYSNHVETGIGNSSLIDMADGSKVRVNAKSSLEYPSLFKYNRKVCLEGEAFFEVEKGGSFKVKTSTGTVEVLGTKFNVISRPEFFEVVCFEGKVKVRIENITRILVKGEAFRFYDGNAEIWIESGMQPQWILGESAFRKAPLQHVISQLQSQYNYDIDYPQGLKNTRFTGSFTHNNIETALQTICIPLNLKYNKTTEGKIIISE